MKRGVAVVPALDVTCWCESRIARVATFDVRAGRTWSCGHVFCVPLAGRENAEPVGRAGFSDGNVTRVSLAA